MRGIQSSSTSIRIARFYFTELSYEAVGPPLVYLVLKSAPVPRPPNDSALLTIV